MYRIQWVKRVRGIRSAIHSSQAILFSIPFGPYFLTKYLLSALLLSSYHALQAFIQSHLDIRIKGIVDKAFLVTE